MCLSEVRLADLIAEMKKNTHFCRGRGQPVNPNKYEEARSRKSGTNKLFSENIR